MRAKPKGAKYRNLTEPDLDEIERMMDHTGHTSAAMIRVDTRRVDATRDHAGEGLL